MDRKIAVFFGLVAFVVYHLNGWVYTGLSDAMATRFIPFAIVNHGTVYVDPYQENVVEKYKDIVAKGELPYWVRQARNGHIGGLFPIVTPVVVSPLYLVASAYLWATGWTSERLEILAPIMEKISASIIASLAAALVFLALRRRQASVQDALLLTAAFAFATGTWSTSSQFLYLNTVAELLCAVTLYLITGPVSKPAAFVAGAAIALFAANRPPDVFMAAALAVPALLWSGRSWWLYLIGGAIPGFLVLAYNVLSFGHPVGAWQMLYPLGGSFFALSPLYGIPGLLVSPARGLFVFYPFLLALPFAIFRALREKRDAMLTVSIVIGLVAEVLFYSTTDWRAGHSYGPRYMFDYLPAMIWLLVPGLQAMKTAARAVFIAAIAFSVWVEYVGAFHHDGTSNQVFFREHNLDFSAAVWDIRNAQFLVDSRAQRKPANMLGELRRLNDTSSAK